MTVSELMRIFDGPSALCDYLLLLRLSTVGRRSTRVFTDDQRASRVFTETVGELQRYYLPIAVSCNYCCRQGTMRVFADGKGERRRSLRGRYANIFRRSAGGRLLANNEDICRRIPVQDSSAILGKTRRGAGGRRAHRSCV